MAKDTWPSTQTKQDLPDNFLKRRKVDIAGRELPPSSDTFTIGTAKSSSSGSSAKPAKPSAPPAKDAVKPGDTNWARKPTQFSLP